MSNWIEIKEPSDITIDKETGMVHILIGFDDFGNNYVEFPLEFIDEAVTRANNENL